MVVRNNLSAINTLNMLNRNHSALAKSLQTVSSGMRINGAKDDASGYAISERMRVQIRSLNQDNSNTQNGHSMMKVAEGAVQSTVDILKTLKEKVINAANDTNTDADRQMIQKELNQSIDQINDNALVTYNEKYLLNGSKNGKSEGTFTALTNSSLHEKTSGGTTLVNLKDRSGQSLNIQTSDRVSVSYVFEGNTYSTSFAVTGSTSIATIVNKAEKLTKAQIFADDTNDSIEAILGPSHNAELIPKANDAVDATDAIKNKAGLANTALSDFSIALHNIGNSSNLSAFSNAPAAFDAWAGNGFPNPAQANTCTVGGTNLANIISAAQTFGSIGDTVAQAIYDTWAIYNTKYGDLSSTIDTQVANIDADVARDASIETNKTSMLNGGMAKMNANYDNAVAYKESIGGACILNGSKIGQDYYGNVISTPDFGSALTITANGRGLDGQISGFTVSVTDHEGNIKKSVNAVLDAWNESIRAENASNDDYALVLQTGTKANQAIKVRMTDMRARALGLLGKDGTPLNVSNQKNANAAINVLDNAIQKALDQQTTIGAIESRLEYTSTNLTTAAENVTASESTIRDADMALAMTQYTKNNILMQASQAMLAQANQSNNQVLSLLR